MSGSLVVFAFLLIVFAPCMLAFDGWKAEDGDWGIPNKWRGMKGQGRAPIPLQADEPEREIGADFEILRFAKGLSQRRLLIQDTEGDPKVTIAQLRQAAAELVELGGMVVAHQLAMAVAVIAAAGKSVAVAARETYAWMVWRDTREFPAQAWDKGPPLLEAISAYVPEQMVSRAA